MAHLLLHSSNKVFPYLKESIGRDWALAGTISRVIFCSLLLQKSILLGCLGGIKKLSGMTGQEDDPEPTASSTRRTVPKWGPWMSGRPGQPKSLGMGFLRLRHQVLSLGPGPSQKWLGSFLTCLPDICSFWSSETGDHLKPVSQANTIIWKILQSVKSTPDVLQIVLGLLALQIFKLENLLCHNKSTRIIK